MKKRLVLEIADAQKILVAAEGEAKKQGWKVTIAIVDDAGLVLLQHRMDGAVPMSALIAPEKARTSVLSRKPSKVFEDMVNKGRFAALKMPVVPLEGGEMIVMEGEVIGAVGVSGAAAGDDALVARAGVIAIGAACALY